MPRKYRPPAAKRRKDRRTTIPYDFEGRVSTRGADDGAPDEEAPIIAVDVAVAEPELEDRPLASAGREGVRHIARDYGYVRGELVRIAAIATFLIVSLVITSIFR